MVCEVGNHSFELQKADILAYKKIGFEPLPICFPHQHQWRLSFRNDRFLHRRKCDLTGASIISMYPADSPYKVYEREAWFSDKWDALTYGRPFDFNRTFFEQYKDVQLEVPRIALVNVGSTNSDFCNSCVFNKNCYLVFGGDRNEDTMYGSLPMFCRNSVDCDWTNNCELCYFSANLEDCYNCRFSFNSKTCTDSSFIEDCIGCSNCILSFNLRNKSYCIENKQYSPEEFAKKKTGILDGSFETQKKVWERFLELRKNRIVKYGHIINGENVSGDYILRSKNSQNCFELIGGEDCREVWTGFNIKDCLNCDYIGEKSALNFNNISCDTAYRVWFSYFTVSSSDVEYSECINFSKNVFGSIALRHHEYVIFNKKYSKEEFEKLRERIIGHMKKTGEWGRYFPKELSTFPYNESTAGIFFPRTQAEAEREGFRWKEDLTKVEPQTYQIPDTIHDTGDEVLNQALACEKTGKNFRIIPQELEFYRKQNIPIPRRHPDTRYYDRLAMRNPFVLHERSCAKCNVPIQTAYAPERPETVYCEKCYLVAVY